MWWPAIAAFLLLLLIFLQVRAQKKLEQARAASRSEIDEARRLHAADLVAAEEQQRAFLDSMIEGLLLLDERGRIQLANRGLEKLFATTSSSIRGKTITEALRNHQLGAVAVRLETEAQIFGAEIQSADVPPRWFQVNASRIAVGSRAGWTIMVFHELTRMKLLENTRQEFVANVSHELRTPLSMIKGYVETLIDGAKDDPQLAARFLQTIEKHTDRLSCLIEDLLTISQLESRSISLQFRSALLRPAVQNVIEDLQARADARAVCLLNEVPEPLRVCADFKRLEQVLWNLIDNAIKYGRAGGQVVVGAKCGVAEEAEIWVRDDGQGISPDAAERVFERFYRVDKARSRDQGGTGLGLAIVKHVVQSHGGRVWVESPAGLGARFHFTLPQQVTPVHPPVI